MHGKWNNDVVTDDTRIYADMTIHHNEWGNLLEKKKENHKKTKQKLYSS